MEKQYMNVTDKLLQLNIQLNKSFMNYREVLGNICQNIVNDLKNKGMKFPQGKIYYFDKN